MSNIFAYSLDAAVASTRGSVFPRNHGLADHSRDFRSICRRLGLGKYRGKSVDCARQPRLRRHFAARVFRAHHQRLSGLGVIYHINDDGRLSELQEKPYDSETLLQSLLAQYPNLLAGDQINNRSPRRWLLVAQEMGLPDKEAGEDRWAVDHLFLDQEGIPTIVEVKRSTDTRIRRMVVGQMLDYAANALTYWQVETIRSRFEATAQAQGQQPEDVLRPFLDPETDIETFWAQVKTNLELGRVRLLFVADVIPPELQRIVEFLNAQMSPAEVLALEIRQFADGRTRTLVPRIIGHTPQGTVRRYPQRASRSWDRDSFMAEIAKRPHGEDLARISGELLEWAEKHAHQVIWGKGAVHGTFIPVIEAHGTKYPLFSVYTNGRFELQFGTIRGKPGFDAAKIQEFRDRLNAIPRISLPKGRADHYPAFPLLSLRDEETLRSVLEVIEWAIDQIRGHNST